MSSYTCLKLGASGFWIVGMHFISLIQRTPCSSLGLFVFSDIPRKPQNVPPSLL